MRRSEKVIDRLVNQAVMDVVKRQAQCGIDVVTDCEQSKLGFFQYQAGRLEGMESRPGRVPLAPWWQLEWTCSRSTTPST